MVFRGIRRREAWDCVCEYVKSICNAVVEGRRWDRRVFYEDVAAAVGLAAGLLEIIAVVLLASLPPHFRKAFSLMYVAMTLIILAFKLDRSDEITWRNSVIRVASCGLPAKYLAVAFIHETRLAATIILGFVVLKIVEPFSHVDFATGVVVLILVILFMFAVGVLVSNAYRPTLNCLKFRDVEVVRERCGEEGVIMARFSLIYIDSLFATSLLSYCCEEARIWLYRNVPEARRAALIYEATHTGLRAVAVAYALYVALRG
ncbi:hypothetical protein Pogu_2272 [Pyrobaculum oguniense TE7]|uniref:Uncharacterized protein n=1 Tax=Pyrobaculum oguniense (strain DSM 13380 / JCM 10595 / TE7) TaxID=698757 RepID=H6QD31_PYROT|nr:hypothetical protein Pogu_2272 [Pyrobaculum oguniense TE7]